MVALPNDVGGLSASSKSVSFPVRTVGIIRVSLSLAPKTTCLLLSSDGDTTLHGLCDVGVPGYVKGPPRRMRVYENDVRELVTEVTEASTDKGAWTLLSKIHAAFMSIVIRLMSEARPGLEYARQNDSIKVLEVALDPSKADREWLQTIVAAEGIGDLTR